MTRTYARGSTPAIARRTHSFPAPGSSYGAATRPARLAQQLGENLTDLAPRGVAPEVVTVAHPQQPVQQPCLGGPHCPRIVIRAEVGNGGT